MEPTTRSFMLKNKLIIILIIFLILAIILAIVFWFLSIQKSKTQENNLGNENFIQEELNNENLQDTKDKTKENKSAPYVSKISEQEKLKAQLTKMSSAFTERFGSYSNQANYENLKDLLPFMTTTFKYWAENKINKATSEIKPAIYYGITTKVLKIELINFSESTNVAKFKISTQRNEVVGSSANSKVIYQNMDLEMKEQGGVWKVNQAVWE